MKEIAKLIEAAKLEIPKLREKRRTRWAADVMERLVAVVEGRTPAPDDPETPRPEHAPQGVVIELTEPKQGKIARKGAKDGS